MNVLHLMSCRGWSSDAYWAARISAELARAGHNVTLVCKRGSERRVIERAQQTGAGQIETLHFAGGIRPIQDSADLVRLRGWLGQADVVHVHRGKEHWLAALANRLSGRRRPLVRTRHIVQPVSAHALNRWLYRHATDRVVTVTEAIRRQYVASGLVPAERVVTLRGGVDAVRFHPGVKPWVLHRALGVDEATPLVGLVSGLRVMKGHLTAVDAAARLAASGRAFQMVFIGRGVMEERVSDAIAEAGLRDRVRMIGFLDDLPEATAALDVALYPPLESDGMSRVLFEYLALGRAVVASRVGVVPEVLEDGRHALLVPAGEPDALARAIARLLDEPALRERLGRSAAALVAERLSGAHVAQRLADLYADLAERATEGSR